jgi:hypothetical protein
MLKFLKKNLKSILLAASLLLNALGGAGIVPPVAVGVGNTVLDLAK